MAYDYEYGVLGEKMIELFSKGAPDFEAAEELIKQGADLNAEGNDDEENILSEILWAYWMSAHENIISDDCETNHNLNPYLGPSMCEIIRFFLAHGFDVTKNDGCYGAQCLYALTLSTFDRYMIEATKILLDAGAKNRTISLTSNDIYETPWSSIASEGSYQSTCEHNHSLANIYEAIYQIYQAVEDGKPYSGIDSYEMAIGKKILKVLAEGNGEHPIFFQMVLPEFQKDNCYTNTLYFVYDGGVLITTNRGDFWTDTVLPDVELVDISEYFEGVVGSTIKRFTFDHKSVVEGKMQLGQPITTIEFDYGRKVRFSINFGEVKEEDLAAYFELVL